MGASGSRAPLFDPASDRIGQIQPVFVHKLICQGTLEERIRKLQANKSQLADSLLSDAARAV